MTDLAEWYKNIPMFTKYWLTLTLAISVLARFEILSVIWLYLAPELIFEKFQLWRLITCVFFYPVGYGFLLNCYFLYSYSLRLENEQFKSAPGDYFYLLFINWACCVIIGLLFKLPLLMDPMILAVVYVWCQFNKEVIVRFWFGTQFKAMYFPWVLLALNVVFKTDVFSSATSSLVGIFVGHLYYFLKIKYPQELGGASYLDTPAIVKSYFPDVRGGVHGFGFAPQNQRRDQPATGQPNRFFSDSWGRGQRLGD